MSATAAPARAEAHRALAEALRRVADAVEALLMEPPPGPRLVPATREELLTLDEAAELLKCSRRHVERLVSEKSCRRRVGRRVLVERAGLLALLRRG